MENYSPAWQTLLANADTAVTSGWIRRNNISQVVILTERSDLVMKSLRSFCQKFRPPKGGVVHGDCWRKYVISGITRRTRSAFWYKFLCAICLCSGSGRCRLWRCCGLRLSAFSGYCSCLQLRGHSCRRDILTGLNLCHIGRTGRRTFGGLCGAERQPVPRWADSLGDMVRPAELDARSPHRAYQKLWISLIIKSITLSKAILTMNMYIIAHQFIFKIICLDNIKLLTQFMC